MYLSEDEATDAAYKWINKLVIAARADSSGIKKMFRASGPVSVMGKVTQGRDYVSKHVALMGDEVFFLDRVFVEMPRSGGTIIKAQFSPSMMALERHNGLKVLDVTLEQAIDIFTGFLDWVESQQEGTGFQQKAIIDDSVNNAENSAWGAW